MSTSKIIKPRHNPLLWTQILPSARASPLDLVNPLSSENLLPSSSKHPQPIPIMPENKNNASLRMILHDTKTTLEQFSDRLGNLTKGVETAKREIDAVNKMFMEANDKLLDEVNAVVNRSQKGLLDALGSPAQVAVLEEIKNSQAVSDRKLDSLENKTGLMQKQLQTISEQQGQILTSLATITPLAPLLKDSPQQQNQIIASLGTLTSLVPFLQSLPAQLKTSQKETLELLTTFFDLTGSRSLSSSSSPTPMSKEKHNSVNVPEATPGHTLKRKYSMQAPSEAQQRNPVENLYGKNANKQQDPIGPSDRTLSSTFVSPLNMKTNSKYVIAPSGLPSASRSPVPLPSLPPSSDIDTGNFSEDRDPKRQRLELSSVRDAPAKDTSSKDTSHEETLRRETFVIPPSRTLSSATFQAPSAAAGERPFLQLKPFFAPRLPANKSAAASPRHTFGSTGTIPTPHAPGSFVQHQSTAPRRILAETSYALNQTPTPPVRNMTRRPSTSGRTLLPKHALPPSSPPFWRGEIAVAQDPPPGTRVNHLIPSSGPEAERGTRPNRSALADIKAHASSSELSVHRPSSRRILFDEKADETSDRD